MRERQEAQSVGPPNSRFSSLYVVKENETLKFALNSAVPRFVGKSEVIRIATWDRYRQVGLSNGFPRCSWITGKPEVITWLQDALLVEVPEQLPCPHSTATQIIECPARRDGEPLRGRSHSLCFGMESTTDSGESQAFRNSLE